MLRATALFASGKELPAIALVEGGIYYQSDGAMKIRCHASIENDVAFYHGRVGRFVAGERAYPQPGGFYGGWMILKICAPGKGLPGTDSW